jgi:hypothetical protein
MLRAVPAMTRQAASSLLELRSAIFVFAISKTCLRVTLPTLLRFGSALAVAMPAAFFKQGAGRRRLGDERKCLVLVHRDHDGNDGSRHLLRRRVKLFAELHDIDALLAQARDRPAAPDSPVPPESAT